MCLRPLQVDSIFALFARWHLFRHVDYLRHQQQVDLWHFDLESGVRVTCDVGYLCCTNFSLPRPLCSRVRPDVCDRQTDVRQKHHLMHPPYGGGSIINSEIFQFLHSNEYGSTLRWLQLRFDFIRSQWCSPLAAVTSTYLLI